MGNSSDKGLLGVIASVIIIAVIVGVLMFVKMPIYFIIGLVVVAAIAIVVIAAIVIVAVVVSIKQGSRPTENRENKNPYSATNEKLKNRMINSNEDINYQTFVKEVPGTEKLIIALKNINIEPTWFMRIYDRSKPNDYTEAVLQSSQKWIFADVVSELTTEGYISYIEDDNHESIVNKLNLSAKRQGLPVFNTFDNSSIQESDTWLDIIKKIGENCDLWKIFVLDVNSAEAYIGVVSSNNQSEFIRLLKEYVRDYGIDYSVYSI